MFQTLRRFTALTVAAGLLALVGVESSDAASLGGATRNLKKAPAAQFIAERHPTLAPFSHVLFCKENPGECSGRGSRDVVVTITADKADELERVNRQVNRAIRPRHDRVPEAGARRRDDERAPRADLDLEELGEARAHVGERRAPRDVDGRLPDDQAAAVGRALALGRRAHERKED